MGDVAMFLLAHGTLWSRPVAVNGKNGKRAAEARGRIGREVPPQHVPIRTPALFGVFCSILLDVTRPTLRFSRRGGDQG